MLAKLKLSIKTGLGFGLTSGVITTLGLMIGLYSGTQSSKAVIGGILTIAVADAFSDALGIHISQESQNQYSFKQIWISTLATFLSKFLMAISFLVPIFLFQLSHAVIISAVWGLFVLTIISYLIAKQEQSDPIKIISEHLVIALLVILATHLLGDWIAISFS